MSFKKIIALLVALDLITFDKGYKLYQVIKDKHAPDDMDLDKLVEIARIAVKEIK